MECLSFINGEITAEPQANFRAVKRRGKGNKFTTALKKKKKKSNPKNPFGGTEEFFSCYWAIHISVVCVCVCVYIQKHMEENSLIFHLLYYC